MADLTIESHSEVRRLLGWSAIIIGGLLALGGTLVGFSPISAEGGPCGSAWLRADPSNSSCGDYYGITTMIATVPLVIGLALLLGGVLLVRRARQDDAAQWWR